MPRRHQQHVGKPSASPEGEDEASQGGPALKGGHLLAQQHLGYQTLTLQASLEDLVRLDEDSLLVCLEE